MFAMQAKKDKESEQAELSMQVAARGFSFVYAGQSPMDSASVGKSAMRLVLIVK
jgi:hypothetical protein